jgi:DNA repair exonuclease SbcCD ATPase subunit
MATVHQNSEKFIQALSQASQQNQALLQTLAQTEYAKPSSKSNAAYIADLQARIAQTDKELKLLHTITEDERKDHVKYRESTVKRFVYKLGGSKGEKKFSDKASKEEQEFVEAWQKERERRESRDELDRALKQAESDRAKLEADKARNEKAQVELDTLYHAIFGGPTPELAGEDQLEDAVRQLTEHYHRSQSQLKVEQQALEALQGARASLGKAGSFMQDAEHASRGDLFGSKSSISLHRTTRSESQTKLTTTR